MTRSPAEQRLYLSSLPFAALPLAVAVYYSFTHQYDLRYLPIAFATFVGVALAMAAARVRARPRHHLPWISVLAAVLGAIAGLGAAWFFDPSWALTTAALVASALFALSWVVSHVLDTVSRPQATLNAPNA